MPNLLTMLTVARAKRRQARSDKPLVFLRSPLGGSGMGMLSFPSWGQNAEALAHRWEQRGAELPFRLVPTMSFTARRLMTRRQLEKSFTAAGLRLAVDATAAVTLLEELLAPQVAAQQNATAAAMRADVTARLEQLVGDSVEATRSDVSTETRQDLVVVTADRLVAVSGSVNAPSTLEWWEMLGAANHLEPKELKVTAQAVLLPGQTVHVTADADGSLELTVAGHPLPVLAKDAEKILAAVARVATVAHV